MKELEEKLSAEASALFQRDAEGPHLADERIAMEPLPSFTPEELAHLARCGECRAVVAARVRGREAEVLRFGWFRTRVVPMLALAAAITAVVILIPRGPETTTKGEETKLVAEVTMIATSTDGQRRDVRNRDHLTLDQRLGFKYGNPKGRHRTLAILGWDGAQVRWYYPERAGQPAQTIESSEAIGVRLPFDIALSDHRPGTLTIVAAFDREPAELAAALERGKVPQGESIGVFELIIEEAKP